MTQPRVTVWFDSGCPLCRAEITLMRRYEELARDGAGWIVVHAPGDAEAGRVADVASRFGALSAVRYHRMASEDLL